MKSDLSLIFMPLSVLCVCMAALALPIFLVLSLIHSAHAKPRTQLIARSCRSDRVPNPINYADNYNKMVLEMEDDMARDMFAFREMGEKPDRLYVFSQCMGDLSGEECKICFDAIRDVLPGCFPATGGRVFFDGCFIRAENYSFFRHTIEPDDLMRCSASVDDRPIFSATARKVINDLARMAGKTDGFAVAYQKSPDVFVFAMANCWKTLDPDMCSACLANAAQGCSSCLPSTEARVFNSGCVLRYSDYDFGNKPNIDHSRESILRYTSYALGGIAVSALMIIIGFYMGKTTYRRSNRHNNSNEMQMDSSLLKRGLNFLQFSYSTLEKATEGFNQAFRLGQGGYGEVFKGTLLGGREIAVKRLFAGGKGRNEEVCNEMDIISKAQHKNLVRFLGCCFTDKDSFLVYEFLVNRSLEHILFDSEKKKELDWKKRLGIIRGTAEGLEYLHKDCQMRIVHRDIKASNILLDIKHKPKIADFGLARFYSCDKSLVSTAIAGTLGYMAPEYIAQGRLTEKVDVYSFGVLVLEIVSGVRNNKFKPPGPSFETLVTHAWNRFQTNTVSEIVDKEMEIEDIGEAIRIVQVGLLCTQVSPSKRPTMTTVIQMIKQRQLELPTPSKPPFIDEHMELSSLLGSCRRRFSCTSDFYTPQHQIFEDDPV